jgi:transcriptional regulator with XRE-family HTH domain
MDSEALASPLDVRIGERVRLALWRARITQQQLADALGLDQASVSRRLRGVTSWKVTEVAVAAELLSLPVYDLMALDEAATA